MRSTGPWDVHPEHPVATVLRCRLLILSPATCMLTVGRSQAATKYSSSVSLLCVISHGAQGSGLTSNFGRCLLPVRQTAAGEDAK